MNKKNIRKLQLVLIFTFIVLAVFLNLWTFKPSTNPTSATEQITGAATLGCTTNAECGATYTCYNTHCYYKCTPGTSGNTVCKSRYGSSASCSSSGICTGYNCVNSGCWYSENWYSEHCDSIATGYCWKILFAPVINCTTNANCGTGYTCNPVMKKCLYACTTDQTCKTHYNDQYASCDSEYKQCLKLCSAAVPTCNNDNDECAGDWWICAEKIPAEICNDTVDNDGDGLNNCADPDCNGYLIEPSKGWKCEYGTEKNCTDEFDNDYDGQYGGIDCGDPDCNGKLSKTGAKCEYGKELSCTDKFDNDRDNKIDSADVDCTSNCPTGYQADPYRGICYYACTSDADCTSRYPVSPYAKCENGICIAQCQPPKPNLVCPTNEMCVASISGSINYKYCIYMKCNDNTDWDKDGCIGSADSDCGGKETSCTDSKDNDCDGSLDAADSDCGGKETNCTDNLDNDNNGLVDCEDSACDGKMPAWSNGYVCEQPEKSCADEYDNDWDGLTDCEDKDCLGVPSCSAFKAVINSLQYPIYPKNYEIIFNGSRSTPSERIKSYSWDFGDDSFGSGAVVSHKFLEAGVYTVSLTVLNETTQNETSISVTINNGEPVPIILSPDRETYFSGEAVIFNHDSYDLDDGLKAAVWDIGRRKYPWGTLVQYAGALTCRSTTDVKEQCTKDYVYDVAEKEGYPCACLDKADSVYKFSYYSNASDIYQIYSAIYASTSDCQYDNIIKGDCVITLIVMDESGMIANATRSFKIVARNTTTNESTSTDQTKACKSNYDNRSHACYSNENDTIYKSGTLSCCCDTGYKPAVSQGKSRCVTIVIHTSPNGGSDIGTTPDGNITNIGDQPVNIVTGGEENGLNWWILVIAVIAITIAFVAYAYWEFKIKPERAEKGTKKPFEGAEPMPTTLPRMRQYGPPIQRPAVLAQPKKSYSEELRKSLSELAKKYQKPNVGTKPETTSSAKKVASKPLLSKPLERLTKPSQKK